jgi:hypothetical protein
MAAKDLAAIVPADQQAAFEVIGRDGTAKPASALADSKRPGHDAAARTWLGAKRNRRRQRDRGRNSWRIVGRGAGLVSPRVGNNGCNGL